LPVRQPGPRRRTAGTSPTPVPDRLHGAADGCEELHIRRTSWIRPPRCGLASRS